MAVVGLVDAVRDFAADVLAQQISVRFGQLQIGATFDGLIVTGVLAVSLFFVGRYFSNAIKKKRK